MNAGHAIGVGAAVAVISALFWRRMRRLETLPVAKNVDLERYQGRWFEVARLPFRFEAKCVADVTATYTLRADGRIDVVNECRKADGRITRAEGWAKVVAGDGSNARLKVTFFPPFFGDYWILALDEGYRWAMVGTPNRKDLWVLSRTAVMDEGVLEGLLRRARELGFVLDGVIFTKQG